MPAPLLLKKPFQLSLALKVKVKGFTRVYAGSSRDHADVKVVRFNNTPTDPALSFGLRRYDY